jgi:hypothetical protein
MVYFILTDINLATSCFLHFTFENLPLTAFRDTGQKAFDSMRPQTKKQEVMTVIRRFMKSRWWNLTCAVTALATVGYVAYMAYTFRVLMVWFLVAAVFMAVYEFWKFASFKNKNAVT